MPQDEGRSGHSPEHQWSGDSPESHEDRNRIVLCHIDLIQNTEATILGTLIDAALSEADFIVYKGIRSDQSPLFVLTWKDTL